MEVLFALAPHCPRVVLDANFKPHDEAQRERLAALQGAVVEVHCRCSPAEAMRRFAERAATRHAAHAMLRVTPELVAQYDQPMGIGIVIDVDTNAPVKFPALLGRVRTALQQ
jgi:hypothetical protein